MSVSEEGEMVLQALARRRSVPRVTEEPPPRELIERILQAGTLGPNHYRTAPWRFVVLTGASRERLGEVMADSVRARVEDPESPECRPLIEREARKPLRAPVIIAVAAVPSEQAKVREIEEIAAVGAGVENMLIAAEAVGLAAMWRTGEPAYDPAVKNFLMLPPQARILAFLYVGYKDIELPGERESNWESATTWMDGEVEP